jgi:hypothetical protein
VQLDGAERCQIAVGHLPETILRDLTINAEPAERLTACSEEGTVLAWTWLEEHVTMLLCEQTCAQVSPDDELAVNWAWPCE